MQRKNMSGISERNLTRLFAAPSFIKIPLLLYCKAA